MGPRPSDSTDGNFDQEDITAMARALDYVCNALDLNDDKVAREKIATRIVQLARNGELRPTKLRDAILAEASGVATH